MNAAPLAGLKVLELARILAGPWIGQTLADLGATVIKVEAPGGDDTRGWGPPFIERQEDKSAAYFYSANRGKMSIVADFKEAEDLALVKGLANEADVLIENFKVGGLKKYGLDFESLKSANPELVYCSVTGFGQSGPYSERAGYDYLIQGMSGLMSVTGEADGQPMKVGVAVTDIFSGLYGVIGVQAALAQRGITGTGQHLDISLFDCATAIMANQAMNYLATGNAPKKLGNQHPNIVPYQVFDVRDGQVILAVGNDGQFRRFCEVLNRNDLASDARFQTNSDRVVHRDDLLPELSDAVKKYSKTKILSMMEQAVVPCAPINSMAEVFADPQIVHRNMQIQPEGIPGLRTPIIFSGATMQLQKTAPRLNQHGVKIKAKRWNAHN